MDELVQKAVNAIIRPPRSEYELNRLPLALDAGDGHKYLRHPVTFVNPRGQTIVGSIYHSINFSPLDGGPCVMYLHGNASSQLEGQFLVPNFVKYGLFVFCFDFAGCGLSGGEYISLGYYETQDVNFLINVLHKQLNMGPFILWGRSMGAATTLLVDNPYVVGKISDSSFTSVYDMCAAIAKSMSLPSMFIPAVVWFLKKKVMAKADFDFNTIAPIEADQRGAVACVFGHADDDDFIPFEQCRRLYDNYGNREKFLMVLEGGHNGRRNADWIRLGVSFALDQFSIKVDNLEISECRKLQSANFHFTSFETMMSNAKSDTVANAAELEEFRQAVIADEKAHKHKHTPEERAELLRRKAEKHAQNEEKRALKRAKREAAAQKRYEHKRNKAIERGEDPDQITMQSIYEEIDRKKEEKKRKKMNKAEPVVESDKPKKIDTTEQVEVEAKNDDKDTKLEAPKEIEDKGADTTVSTSDDKPKLDE